MNEMGSAFLAKTSEGVLAFATDPQALQFLLSQGCELRLDPNVDPKACAMDLISQGLEKDIIVQGSVFPLGLQQEQDFINFCAYWSAANTRTVEDAVSVLDSAYQVVSNLVLALNKFRFDSDRNAFLWVDDDHPEGHPLPDVVDLWSARHSDQDFSYALFGAHTETAVLVTLQN